MPPEHATSEPTGPESPRTCVLSDRLTIRRRKSDTAHGFQQRLRRSYAFACLCRAYRTELVVLACLMG